MPRIPLSDNGSDPFYRILGHRPEVLEAWSAVDKTFLSPDAILPVELKEEARRELAQNIGCAFCATVGGLPSSEYPSPRQALASAFARQLSEDYREIDDAMFEALREEFTTEEIVELVSWLCFKYGANMFGALMKLSAATDDERSVYTDIVASASVA